MAVCVTNSMKTNLSMAQVCDLPSQWGGMKVAYEIFLGHKETKPYYDFDFFCGEKRPSDTIISRLYYECVSALSTFSGKLYTLKNKEFNKERLCASSLHGMRTNSETKTEMYKISFHFVDDSGLLIKPIELVEIMKQNKILFNKWESWDTSVYSNGQQKFRLPTSVKDENDTRTPNIITGFLRHFQVSENQQLDPKVTYDKPENVYKKTIKNNNKKSEKKTKKNSDINYNNMLNIDEVNKLLELIPSDKYTTWIQVGFYLKQFGDKGWELWDKWSMKSVKYDGPEITKEKWDTFSPETSLTIRRLHKFASESNFNKYVEYFENEFQVISEIFFLNTDVKYANYLIEVEKIQNKIKVIGTKGECYVYNENTALWGRQLMKNQTKYMCDLLCDKLVNFVLPYYKHKLSKINNVDEIDAIKENIKELNKVYKKLNTMSIRKNILSAVTDDSRIRDDNFLFKLTKYKNLISVNENVIDLKTGRQRPRMETDYQVNSLDLENFIEYTPEDHENKTDFADFVLDILGDNVELYNYLQKILGYYITKETKESKALFLTGFGSNGKSLLTNLLTNTLGPNCSKVPSEIFDANQKVNTNSASPQEASLFNVAIGVVTETNEDLRLDKKFKEMVDSGNNDKARHLNGDLFEFERTAKLLITTNNIPRFNAENSFVRRIDICPFEQTYAEEADKEKGEKEINKNLQNELLENKEEILNWLIDGAIKYYQGGLGVTPKKMVAEMKMEIETNDWLSEFIYVNDENAIVSNTDVRDILILKDKCKKGQRIRTHYVKALEKAGFVRDKRGGSWSNMKLAQEEEYQEKIENKECNITDSDSD